MIKNLWFKFIKWWKDQNEKARQRKKDLEGYNISYRKADNDLKLYLIIIACGLGIYNIMNFLDFAIIFKFGINSEFRNYASMVTLLTGILLLFRASLHYIEANILNPDGYSYHSKKVDKTL